MKKSSFRQINRLLFLAVFALSSFQVFSVKPVAKPVTKPVTKPIVLIKTSMGDVELALFPNEAPETVKNFIDLAEGKKEFTDPKSNKKVKKPFYDGLVFHRVIDKFMIQGGCPLGTGTGNPGYRFADEINAQKLGLDKKKVIVDGKLNPLLGIRSRQQYQQYVLLPVLQVLGIKNQADLSKRKKEVEAAIAKLSLLDVFQSMGYKYNTTRNSHAPMRGFIAMANSGPNTNGSQFFINVIDTPWLTGKHTVFGKVIKGMDVVDKISKAAVAPGGKPVTPIKIISIRVKK